MERYIKIQPNFICHIYPKVCWPAEGQCTYIHLSHMCCLFLPPPFFEVHVLPAYQSHMFNRLQEAASVLAPA